jgi:hypothetical protein
MQDPIRAAEATRATHGESLTPLRDPALFAAVRVDRQIGVYLSVVPAVTLVD